MRSKQTIEEAFPDVAPGLRPFGSRVLVQIRTAMKVSAGGIIVPEGARETDRDNCQIAKVIALGPVAFKNRETLAAWPEGAWCKPGDYIRAPKYGGDRWRRPVPGASRGEEAEFVVMNDLDLIGDCTIDPRDIPAYL